MRNHPSVSSLGSNEVVKVESLGGTDPLFLAFLFVVSGGVGESTRKRTKSTAGRTPVLGCICDTTPRMVLAPFSASRHCVRGQSHDHISDDRTRNAMTVPYTVVI